MNAKPAVGEKLLAAGEEHHNVYSRRCTAFLCALCSIASLTGCYSYTETTDRLPDGVPKGHVVFYRGNLSEEGLRKFAIGIYQLQDGEEIPIGYCVGGVALGSRQKVACRPGQHTFAVKLGNTDERVRVDVKRDKVTPVRIMVTSAQAVQAPGLPMITLTPGVIVEYHPSTHTATIHTYEMSLDVEETLLIE
jgi:hypothetical protein